LIAPVQPVTHASVRIQTEAPVQPEERRPLGDYWPAVRAAAVLVLFATGAIWVLGGARRSRHVPPAEAHEAYLKGRYFLDQRSIRGWQQALQQFERAVALDARDPAAQAGLADTYSAMSDFGVASPAEMRPVAMKAAQRALELDPQSAEAQAALGRAQFLFDWDFAAAERRLTRAVALDPDYMPAYQAMAWVKSARGQYAEAVAAARRARQLDPVNTARYTELAWVLALGGRHDEALGEIERALQLNPQSFETYLMKGWACELAGHEDAAFAAYREALRLAGAPEESVLRAEATYRAGGLPGYYRGWLNGRGGNTPMSDTWRAQLFVRAGEFDRAIESLEHAYEKREGALAWVNVEPSFQALRSDARFQRIAARVGRQN
jgi:tetratricopeptide (TPR) repeat protein